jgi:integrase/recombinase XerC
MKGIFFMLGREFHQYLQNERQYSPHTVLAYTSDLSDFQAFLLREYELNAELPADVADVTHRMIRAWLGDLDDAKCSARTLARKRASVSAYFRWLLRTGRIENNPVKLIHSPKFEKKLPAVLQSDAIDRLFDQIDYPEGWEGSRDRCILEVFYACGLRRAELISLQYHDINFLRQTLKVMGKGRKERIIPFGKKAALAMKDYMQACERQGVNLQGVFFVKKDGNPLYPRLVHNIVTQYLQAASSLAKTSPHVLRHTFATHLLDRGADLNAIKEMLGHSSLAATQVYVHNSISKLKDVYTKAHPKA